MASDIISIRVALEGAATSRQSFGVPLILDFDNVLASPSDPGDGVIYGVYSSFDELKDAGFKRWHPATKMVRCLFAQDPRVPSVVIVGKHSSASIEDTLDALQQTYPDWHCLLLTSRDAADLKDASKWVESAEPRRVCVLETNGNLSPGVSVMTELYTAQRQRTLLLAQLSRVQKVRIYFDKELASGQTVDGKINGVSWSQVTYATSHNATMDALATEIAGEAGVDTATAGVSGGLGASKDYIEITAKQSLADLYLSDIAVAGGSSQAATRVLESQASNWPLDAGLAGVCLPFDPGTETWAYKTPALCEPTTTSTSIKAHLKANRANWFDRDLGKSLTKYGTSSADIASGTPLFFDLIRLKDAVESDVVTAIHDTITSSLRPKLPYTNAGIAALAAALMAVEDKYVQRGAFVRKPVDQTYMIPSVEEQLASDVSNRIVRGLKATWQTSGGIQFAFDVAVTLRA